MNTKSTQFSKLNVVFIQQKHTFNVYLLYIYNIMKKERINKTEILTDLGIKLKKIRLNENLTQKEVSEKTGIDRATISQIENGKNTSVVYLLKLLNQYNKLEDFLNVLYLPEISPIELYKLDKKKKKYASSKKK